MTLRKIGSAFLGAVMVAGIAAVSLASAPTASAATSTRIRVATINVHGATDSHGGGNHGAVAPVVGLVLDAVAKFKGDQTSTVNGVPVTQNLGGVQVIGLQELCVNQYNGIRAALDEDWPGWKGHFVKVRSNVDGCQGKDYGIALLVKSGTKFKSIDHTTLIKVAPSQTRMVGCLTAKVRGVWNRICVTHLDYHKNSADRSKDVNLQQAKQLAELMKDAKKTDKSLTKGRVLLAADVNFDYGMNREQLLADVLPVEHIPADVMVPSLGKNLFDSVDRVKASRGSMPTGVFNIHRYWDGGSEAASRTDHLIYAANIYVPND